MKEGVSFPKELTQSFLRLLPLPKRVAFTSVCRDWRQIVTESVSQLVISHTITDIVHHFWKGKDVLYAPWGTQPSSLPSSNSSRTFTTSTFVLSLPKTETIFVKSFRPSLHGSLP
jgi:hypothetical protein